MDEFPPEFPEVDPNALRSIIDFAQQYVAWLKDEADRATEHGHQLDRFNAIGWQFVADALAEQLD